MPFQTGSSSAVPCDRRYSIGSPRQRPIDRESAMYPRAWHDVQLARYRRTEVSIASGTVDPSRNPRDVVDEGRSCPGPNGIYTHIVVSQMSELLSESSAQASRQSSNFYLQQTKPAVTTNPKLLSLFASALALARADFLLYAAQQNDIVDSGTGFQTQLLYAFPGEPSCEDVSSYGYVTAQGLNDASSSGKAYTSLALLSNLR